MVLNKTILPDYNITANPSEKLLELGRDQLLRIEVCVSVTAVLLSTLAVFGSTRRRLDSVFVKFPVWAAYVLSSQLTIYALGLMQSFTFHNESFKFWAAFLLFALAKADSMTAFSLDDNNSRKKFLGVAVLQGYLVIFLIPTYNDDFYYGLLMAWLINLAAFLKPFSTAEMMRSASMSSGLARYRDIHRCVACQEDQVNPQTMVGYNYYLNGDVTLKEIWQCQGRPLTRPFCGELRKDLCLSFAFFRIICSRFVGYSLPECIREKNWNLVRNGLLSDEAAGSGHERAFRVVEMELAFLYDFFYTRYPLIMDDKRRLRWRIVELAIVVLGCWAAAYTLSRVPQTKEHMALVTKSGLYIDIRVTAVVITSMLLVQFVQFFYFLTSDWLKISVICKYVRDTPWKNKEWMEKLVEIICYKQWKPWERKLGQYSLLKSFGYNPSRIIYNGLVALAIDKPRPGQKLSKAVGLPEQVKAAIVASLKANGSRSSNGESSLHRNGFGDQLGWTCNLESTTHVILVWHIATSVCEMTPSPKTDKARLKKSDQFIVADSLSKYCAYLVAFLPKLLPGPWSETEIIFDNVIGKARNHLGGSKTKARKYAKMMELGHGPRERSIVRKGARLGAWLVEQVDQELRWKVLADFWAEFVLFLAPSEELTAHAEQLANGGELLTHLWALLFHAGIVTRDSASPAP